MNSLFNAQLSCLLDHSDLSAGVSQLTWSASHNRLHLSTAEGHFLD